MCDGDDGTCPQWNDGTVGARREERALFIGVCERALLRDGLLCVALAPARPRTPGRKLAIERDSRSAPIEPALVGAQGWVQAARRHGIPTAPLRRVADESDVPIPQLGSRQLAELRVGDPPARVRQTRWSMPRVRDGHSRRGRRAQPCHTHDIEHAYQTDVTGGKVGDCVLPSMLPSEVALPTSALALWRDFGPETRTLNGTQWEWLAHTHPYWFRPPPGVCYVCPMRARTTAVRVEDAASFFSLVTRTNFGTFQVQRTLTSKPGCGASAGRTRNKAPSLGNYATLERAVMAAAIARHFQIFSRKAIAYLVGFPGLLEREHFDSNIMRTGRS